MNSPVTNEQIDYVFKQLKITGWPHVLSVLIVTVAIWNYEKTYLIIGWCVCIQFSHFCRVIFLDSTWETYKEKTVDYRRVSLLLCCGMLFTGAMWSVIPLLFMNDPHSETFIFISISLAGLVAATLPALAAYLPAYLCFVGPVLITLAYRYYDVGLEASALLTLLFISVVVGISYTINAIITRSITIDFKNVVLLREVTKAKEIAEDANQAKSRFLAAASHDLRQPLQALGLILESMRVRTLSGKSSSEKDLALLVERGLESHDSMSALFNALLELSRFESHELDVTCIDFSINEMLESIVNEFQPSAKVKCLTLTQRGSEAVTKTDPVLFGRVVRNLLSNAIKFTQKGSITVVIEEKESGVLLSIIDTGVGIPKSEQGKVFDEYHQVSNEARRRHEGIGLGLSVVKKMCELLELPIHLESSLGLGTTFSIILPGGDREKIAPKVSGVVQLVGQYRVLVVDDDPMILAAISTLMGDWKCPCIVAECIDSALDILQRSEFVPDLILTDYRLGEGVTGIDAIESIRQYMGSDTPALIMSGDTDSELVREIREKKYYLIQKPVKPLHLQKVMAKLLKKKQANQ